MPLTALGAIEEPVTTESLIRQAGLSDGPEFEERNGDIVGTAVCDNLTAFQFIIHPPTLAATSSKHRAPAVPRNRLQVCIGAISRQISLLLMPLPAVNLPHSTSPHS